MSQDILKINMVNNIKIIFSSIVFVPISYVRFDLSVLCINIGTTFPILLNNSIILKYLELFMYFYIV